MDRPQISVLLPVYNAERFIAQSIQSVLSQSYRHFELIILNDGSTDRSEEIIKSFDDPRIKYFYHSNRGLAATLNRGIDLAQNEFIARQDNDDVSLPERFEKQMHYFRQHPDCVLLGTAAEIIDEKGFPTGKFHRHPVNSSDLKVALLFDNPFVHSAVIFRKSAVVKAGKYSENSAFFEDHNLWSALSRGQTVANLQDVLLRYRQVGTGMSETTRDYSARVINQSVQNILYYLPALDRKSIETVIDPPLSLAHSKSVAASVLSFERLLQDLAVSLNRRENTSVSSSHIVFRKMLFNFKRKLYNTIIYSSGYTVFEKTEMRLRRKLLFLKEGKFFEG